MPPHPKPTWLKKTYSTDPNIGATRDILGALDLNTVCEEAMCPNYAECFSRKTATFMILGVHCTRDCAFCNVTHAEPQSVDAGEPERIGVAVAAMGLSYVVVTSVTRDDLPDGGAGQFAKVIAAIRAHSPGTRVEVLVPDFAGSHAALETVAAAAPDVISHNMETVRELYDAVRPGAVYGRSLLLLKRIGELAPGIRSKSGFMLGLGERREWVDELMDDLREADCELLTIGQYLAPSAAHFPVAEYVSPEVFDLYKEAAAAKGFTHTASAPFVRSSYMAEEALRSK